MTRILNVAEKNDASKSIADIMSSGRYQRREGFSVYNKIYEFQYNIFNSNASMIMTSVSGHLLNYDFTGLYKNWNGCNPVMLFEAPIEKFCSENSKNIKRTLEREIRSCQYLIIWTDCDREGENIGFEIIEVCTAVKPNIKVFRAKFSEITNQAITRAINNLIMPDKLTSEAVDVRQELDLRIGAAFTRFQTLRLQRVFPDVLSEHLISYGSCQFPTLGFVVERYKQFQQFIAEPFWKIKVVCKSDDFEEAEFVWKRQRLFDYMACLAIYEHIIEKPEMKIIEINSKPKSKWRPCALDTVELEKLASRKLHISAKETMNIAEKLYTQGLISYPRTETNIFPKDFDLQTLVQNQINDPHWGDFATRLMTEGIHPRNGNKTDQAHPPIHPTKYVSNLQGNEKIIYEFIVRHFLACCSRDAQGQETTIEANINNELFSVSGLMILAKNYLDVYTYEKWNTKTIPIFELNETYLPSVIEMVQSETTPPSLLTEADLIALMEKHGIGTDATHAEHIETIKSRLYVGVLEDGRFVPGELGMGLVEGYDSMGYEMSKPNLRAELEANLKLISTGHKDKNVVLAEQIQKYKEVFIEACLQAAKIDEALSKFFGTAQEPANQTTDDTINYMPLCKCPSCNKDLVIRRRKDNIGLYVTCMSFPNCKTSIWFPNGVLSAEVLDSICPECKPEPIHKIKFKFRPGSVPMYIPNEYESCIGGCDTMLNDALDISFPKQQPKTPANHRILNNAAAQFNQNLHSSNRYPNPTQNTVLRPQSNMNKVQTTNIYPGTQTITNNIVSRRPLGGNNDMIRQPTPHRLNLIDSNDNNEIRAVVCHCGLDANLLTVKKEGPNIGRQFYGCQKPMDSKCGFFLWADDVASTSNSNTRLPSGGHLQRSNNGNATNYEATAIPSCNCNQPAKLKTVQKDGPNKGRPFYCCNKPMGQGCNFFKWSQNDFQNQNNVPSSNLQMKIPKHIRSKNSTNEPVVRNKRKCGLCGEEGHTKKTCPHNR